MSEYLGKYAVIAGSFNPLHNGHILFFSKILEKFEYCACLVRYNEGVDLTDWETKKGWFDRLSAERFDGRLIPFKEIPSTKGKVYGIDIFHDLVRKSEQLLKEPVDGFVFGEDYGGMIGKMQELYPDKHFLVIDRKEEGTYNSTAIREDLEANRKWLPEYVYQSLKKVQGNQK